MPLGPRPGGRQSFSLGWTWGPLWVLPGWSAALELVEQISLGQQPPPPAPSSRDGMGHGKRAQVLPLLPAWVGSSVRSLPPLGSPAPASLAASLPRTPCRVVALLPTNQRVRLCSVPLPPWGRGSHPLPPWGTLSSLCCLGAWDQSWPQGCKQGCCAPHWHGTQPPVQQAQHGLPAGWWHCSAPGLLQPLTPSLHLGRALKASGGQGRAGRATWPGAALPGERPGSGSSAHTPTMSLARAGRQPPFTVCQGRGGTGVGASGTRWALLALCPPCCPTQSLGWGKKEEVGGEQQRLA